MLKKYMKRERLGTPALDCIPSQQSDKVRNVRFIDFPECCALGLSLTKDQQQTTNVGVPHWLRSVFFLKFFKRVSWLSFRVSTPFSLLQDVGILLTDFHKKQVSVQICLII